MSTKTKPLPPLLEPYLSLPPETTLITLTGTLACSTTWLTARFIASILSEEENPHSVLLASYLHPENFWRNEVKRTTGLSLAGQKNFTFVDSTSLTELEGKIASSSPSSSKVVLILDHPSLSLFTTKAQDLNTTLLHLRSRAHATILLDFPSLSNDLSTPLDREISSFQTTQIHASSFVMSFRELETGAARDVSGVLRITRGGEGEGEGEVEKVEEAEFLYLIQRDGGAKVFKRGSGDVS